MNLTYSEMVQHSTYLERFRYLSQKSVLGEETFGSNRYLNQDFYKSKEWHNIRNYVIVRDGGCDLGIPDCPIKGPIYIHHLNPITEEDIIMHSDNLLDPENLVCVSRDTHNAIHYGSEEILNKYEMVHREPNDTCPWKK